jgi:hypothetical protein
MGIDMNKDDLHRRVAAINRASLAPASDDETLIERIRTTRADMLKHPASTSWAVDADRLLADLETRLSRE